MAHPIDVPAAAAIPPAPGAPPAPAFVAPAPRTSYRELYSDAASNPAPDRTAGYLAGYCFTDAEGGAIPTPANLRDQTIALSDRQPMAFLALVTGQDGQYEVTVIQPPDVTVLGHSKR